MHYQRIRSTSGATSARRLTARIGTATSVCHRCRVPCPRGCPPCPASAASARLPTASMSTARGAPRRTCTQGTTRYYRCLVLIGLSGDDSNAQAKDSNLSQHSYPTLPQRRTGGRRLPPTPKKPSTLHFGAVGSVVMAAQRNPRDRHMPGNGKNFHGEIR